MAATAYKRINPDPGMSIPMTVKISPRRIG
jgi:hypothetical protein